jgi:hypothetical protein
MKVNMDWVKYQLGNLNVRMGNGNAIIHLLNAWKELPEFKREDAEQIANIFMHLALEHSLVPPPKDEVYVQAERGALKVRDIVRVKNDAFAGELGMIHNGRPGVIVAIRSGDIIVDLTDLENPPVKSAHYQPENLLKRVQ